MDLIGTIKSWFRPTPNSKYGWNPDKLDARDHVYTMPPRMVLPTAVDLTPKYPQVFDQSSLGCCVGHGVGEGFQFDAIRQNLPDANIIPSRLFIYYNARLMEGTVREDSGCQIRDGIKVIARQGACPETDWPYIIKRFATRPPCRAYTHALRHRAIQYKRLDNSNINILKGCLAEGFPFIFGMCVYDSFESEAVFRTGVVPMPNLNTESLLGGHCMLCVGYNTRKKWFIVKNSWGTGWGAAGNCYIPFAYLTNTSMADDFWTIRLVS